MVNEKVLLWDKRREPQGAHGKFESLWKGPYKIRKVLSPNSFKMRYQDRTKMFCLIIGETSNYTNSENFSFLVKNYIVFYCVIVFFSSLVFFLVHLFVLFS